MTKKLIMILGLVLSSMLMKAQAFFVPFPKAGDKYWQKQVPVAMRNDYIRLGNLYQKKPWWGIPAHYPKDHPEKDIQPVDLFNAETAGMLAWTLYMLEDEINRKEKGLCNQVRSEIDRRFLKPVLNQPQGWKNNANNWNTWITSNWLETVLICESDAKQRDAAFKGVQQCLRTFMKGYPDDGGCEEGVSYWDCAGVSFFESLYFMQFTPKQAVLTLTDAQKKVENMGRFITTMYINDLTFVNFSDAQAQNVPNINILFPLGFWSCYIRNKSSIVITFCILPAYSLNFRPYVVMSVR